MDGYAGLEGWMDGYACVCVGLIVGLLANFACGEFC